jgi:hypothetical protein
MWCQMRNDRMILYGALDKPVAGSLLKVTSGQLRKTTKGSGRGLPAENRTRDLLNAKR